MDFLPGAAVVVRNRAMRQSNPRLNLKRQHYRRALRRDAPERARNFAHRDGFHLLRGLNGSATIRKRKSKKGRSATMLNPKIVKASGAKGE